MVLEKDLRYCMSSKLIYTKKIIDNIKEQIVSEFSGYKRFVIHGKDITSSISEAHKQILRLL